MAHTLPSTLRLFSLAFGRFKARASTHLKAALLAIVLGAVVLYSYVFYSLSVLSFSEAGGEVVPEHFLAITLGALGSLGLVFFCYIGFTLILADNPKAKVGPAIRELPRTFIIVFLWWLWMFFVPGFVAGFFLSSTPPETLQYLPSILTAVLCIITLSMSLLVPQLAIGKRMKFFASLFQSIRSTWPVLHLLLLRLVVLWVISVAFLFLVTIAGTIIALILPDLAAALFSALLTAFVAVVLALLWIFSIVVLAEHVSLKRS